MGRRYHGKQSGMGVLATARQMQSQMQFAQKTWPPHGIPWGGHVCLLSTPTATILGRAARRN